VTFNAIVLAAAGPDVTGYSELCGEWRQSSVWVNCVRPRPLWPILYCRHPRNCVQSNVICRLHRNCSTDRPAGEQFRLTVLSVICLLNVRRHWLTWKR